jgi:hypothetical protein
MALWSIQSLTEMNCFTFTFIEGKLVVQYNAISQNCPKENEGKDRTATWKKDLSNKN